MAGILDAVKKGFDIATKSLGLVLILILFNFVGNLMSAPFTVQPGVTPSPQLTAGAVIFSILFILVSVFFQGGTLGLVRDAIKEGKMKLASLVAYGLKYYLRLFVLGLIVIVIIGAVALVAGLVIVITTPLNNAAISVIATVIAITIALIATLFLFVPLLLAPYALVCEDMGAVAAIKRSLKVAKARIFAVLLLLIVMILISLGIGFIVGFLVGLIAAVLPVTAGKILMTLATSIVNGYLGIVMTASFMVFYLGLTREKAAA